MKTYIFARILLEQIVCKYGKEQQNQPNPKPNKSNSKKSKIRVFEGSDFLH